MSSHLSNLFFWRQGPFKGSNLDTLAIENESNNAQLQALKTRYQVPFATIRAGVGTNRARPLLAARR